MQESRFAKGSDGEMTSNHTTLINGTTQVCCEN